MGKAQDLMKQALELDLGCDFHGGEYDLPENVAGVFAAMRQRYPSLTSLGLVPKLSCEDLEKLLVARNDWFKKWLT